MSEGDIEKGASFFGTAYVLGQASGKLLACDTELSFWGGVDPQTGEVIDRHHPLCGVSLQDAILAIPGGRGSCSGSGVMLELLLNGKAPKAMLFERREDILTLGVIIAEEIFGKSIPVVTMTSRDFQSISKSNARVAHVARDHVRVSDSTAFQPHLTPVARNGEEDSGQGNEPRSNIQLTRGDMALLDGSRGRAGKAAMKIVLRMADLMGARALIDVSQVHVDGCIYTGPGSLAFAEKLRDEGAKVRVPTTLNSISVDQRRWRAQGIEPIFGEAALALADTYVGMGARPTFTCAPYTLEDAPGFGDQVAWAESNAVVYANSVLGARTMKYPDFLDICIALTGRAPKAGLHLSHNRLASVVVYLPDLAAVPGIDDLIYPLLGYHVGSISPCRIPVVVGLDALAPSRDNLKAFGAAFATMSSAPMFHLVRVTPEAPSVEAVTSPEEQAARFDVELQHLRRTWHALNSAEPGEKVDLVSLGNPHFSMTEVRKLAGLCRERTRRNAVPIVVTCGRATYELAGQAGLVEELEACGVSFITDTCWCMITDPVIPRQAKVIMTNSAKYAHYGLGLTGRRFRFASLAECVAGKSSTCVFNEGG